MSSASTSIHVPLESVISTEELNLRPSREPDHAATNKALVELSQQMANAPKNILQKLVETALTLCRADSSGLSLLEEENGKKIFRWHGVAGEYAPHLWGTTPREFSPCGTVLDTDGLQLMSYLDRHFDYFAEVSPRIVEALLVPFHVGGVAVGTIWVISHSESRKFDAEDARIIRNLGEFAASAYQLTSSRAALEQTNAELLNSNGALKAEILERKRFELALKAANTDLEQFAFTASHDLQQPLRTVAAFAQLLGKRTHGQLDPEAEQLLHHIVDGARRMKELIDGVLEYSRINRTSEAALEPVDLRETLGSTVQDLQAAVTEEGVEITQDELPTVYADEPQLRQLLQNLISNAIKYRRTGESPRVHVSAQRSADFWTISVRDNGQGFAPEYAEQVFRLFKRLHGSDVPGAGIGLSICQKIVERHGGAIWATSEPGQGSTFFFTLPTLEPA